MDQYQENKGKQGPAELDVTTNSQESTDCMRTEPEHAHHNEERSPSYLRENEIRRLLSNMPVSKYKYVVTTILCTGMRLNEILELKVRDVDFSKGYINICSRGMKQRHVPMTESLQEELYNYLKTFRQPRNDNDQFFDGLTHEGVIWALIEARMHSKVPYLTISMLRWLFASSLLEKGYELRRVCELLGVTPERLVRMKKEFRRGPHGDAIERRLKIRNYGRVALVLALLFGELH